MKIRFNASSMRGNRALQKSLERQGATRGREGKSKIKVEGGERLIITFWESKSGDKEAHIFPTSWKMQPSALQAYTANCPKQDLQLHHEGEKTTNAKKNQNGRERKREGGRAYNPRGNKGNAYL